MPKYGVAVHQVMTTLHTVEADCEDDLQEEVNELGSDGLSDCRIETVSRTCVVESATLLADVEETTRRIQYLTANENGTWDTLTVYVPASVGTKREALVKWAESNLAPQAQYRKIVLFALYSTEPEE